MCGAMSSIARVKHERGFTIIDNAALCDQRLSWKARGLLAYLLSRPDHWKVIAEALENEAPDGRASVRSGLAELQHFGYLVVTKGRDEHGRFVVTDTTVYERPVRTESENQFVDPTSDDEVKDQVTPETGFPHADNRPLVNKDLGSTEIGSTGAYGDETPPQASYGEMSLPRSQWLLLREQLCAEVYGHADHGLLDADQLGALNNACSRLAKFGIAPATVHAFACYWLNAGDHYLTAHTFCNADGWDLCGYEDDAESWSQTLADNGRLLTVQFGEVERWRARTVDDL